MSAVRFADDALWKQLVMLEQKQVTLDLIHKNCMRFNEDECEIWDWTKQPFDLVNYWWGSNSTKISQQWGFRWSATWAWACSVLWQQRWPIAFCMEKEYRQQNIGWIYFTLVCTTYTAPGILCSVLVPPIEERHWKLGRFLNRNSVLRTFENLTHEERL